MADLSDSPSSEKNPFEELTVVYVLYFDAARGHVPLLIYPDDRYKDNKKFMRPIKYHPIWFLSVNESDALDHIDLEYKGYTFFGKKFITFSQREKRRAGLTGEKSENIVIILSLPDKIEIFGDELIRRLTQDIKENFEKKIFEIIESEILKDDVIKSPKTKRIIEAGDKIKKQLREMIDNTTDLFFSTVIKQANASSIRTQKAIAYLALKGIDVSHIHSEDYDGSFSSIQLFEPNKKGEVIYIDKNPFILLNINITEDSHELEILVQNNSLNEKKGLIIKITYGDI